MCTGEDLAAHRHSEQECSFANQPAHPVGNFNSRHADTQLLSALKRRWRSAVRRLLLSLMLLAWRLRSAAKNPQENPDQRGLPRCVTPCCNRGSPAAALCRWPAQRPCRHSSSRPELPSHRPSEWLLRSSRRRSTRKKCASAASITIMSTIAS